MGHFSGSSRFFRCGHCTTQPGVICQLAEAAPNPFVYVNEGIKEHWSQRGTWRTPFVTDVLDPSQRSEHLRGEWCILLGSSVRLPKPQRRSSLKLKGEGQEVITEYNRQDAECTSSEQGKLQSEHFRRVKQRGKTKCVGG